VLGEKDLELEGGSKRERAGGSEGERGRERVE